MNDMLTINYMIFCIYCIITNEGIEGLLIQFLLSREKNTDLNLDCPKFVIWSVRLMASLC